MQPQKPPVSVNQIVLGTINSHYGQASADTSLSDSGGVYTLDMQDLELLQKFQARTVLTMGTEKSRNIYQGAVLRLAFSVSMIVH